MVTAARLDTPVEIQRRALRRNTDGTQHEAWSAIAKVWADLQPVRGSEVLEADRASGRVRYAARMRWYDDLRSSDRLVVAGHVYEIAAIRPGWRRNHEMIVECIAVEGE